MIVGTGGSGFLGSALVATLRGRGRDVAVVTRDPANARIPAGTRVVSWGDLSAAVDGADAVVDLAGETIAQRWTPSAKARTPSSTTRRRKRC